MISVVMATYNGEKYLHEQLASVTTQLRDTDEFIICDDGSTDATMQILEEYRSNHSNVSLYKGPGKGPKENFEYGLSLAKGKYIFLCDQDDIWYEDKIKIMVRGLKTHMLCVCDSRLIDGEGGIISQSYMDDHNSRFGFLNNIVKNSFVGCHMAFSSELLKTALPIPEKVPMHDMWLGLITERKGRVLWLKQPLMDYRRHEETYTGSKNGVGTMIKFRFRLVIELIKRLHT